MAIKIIKQGVKEFHIICPYCGCEFTYENEDVHEGIVSCPCCGAILDAKERMSGKVDEAPLPTNGGYGTIANPHGTYPYNDLVYRPFTLPSWTKTLDWSDCEGCPNNPKYIKTPYVGDNPCLWCQKSPLRVTCTSNPRK